MRLLWLWNESKSMKKILSLVLIVAAVGAVAAVNVRWNDEPDYIQAAETRVGSYLTSDYGRVTCNSARVNAQRWELGCVNKAKGKNFQFAVYSADEAPYGVSRPFYLEALNDDAKDSASYGLMRYLQINTKAG